MKYYGFSKTAIKWRTHVPLKHPLKALNVLKGCHHIRIKPVRYRADGSYFELCWRVEGYELEEDFK